MRQFISSIINRLWLLLIRWRMAGLQCERCGVELYARDWESLDWQAKAHACYQAEPEERKD